MNRANVFRIKSTDFWYELDGTTLVSGRRSEIACACVPRCGCGGAKLPLVIINMSSYQKMVTKYNFVMYCGCFCFAGGNSWCARTLPNGNLAIIATQSHHKWTPLLSAESFGICESQRWFRYIFTHAQAHPSCHHGAHGRALVLCWCKSYSRGIADVRGKNGIKHPEYSEGTDLWAYICLPLAVCLEAWPFGKYSSDLWQLFCILNPKFATE